MKLSVCVETFLMDRDLGDRLKLVRDLGIGQVELWTMNSRDPNEIHNLLLQFEMELVLFCANVDHSLVDPNDRAGFLKELGESAERARTTNCGRLALLTNRVDSKGIPEPPPEELSRDEQLLSVYEGIRQAIETLEDEEMSFLIEPLNTRVDHPGYFIEGSRLAFDLVRSLGEARFKVLYDIYHLQIMEGNLIETIEKHVDLIGHIHVADVPGRHELGTGEINFSRLADALKSNGYEGSIGLECFPQSDPDTALAGFKSIFS